MLALDDGRIMYSFAVDVGADPKQPDQFRPKLNSAQSSSLATPTEKTLAKQRAAETKTRDDVDAGRLENVSPSTRAAATHTTSTTPARPKVAQKTETKRPSKFAQALRNGSEKGTGNNLER